MILPAIPPVVGIFAEIVALCELLLDVEFD
jgi:hypothetical protein